MSYSKFIMEEYLLSEGGGSRARKRERNQAERSDILNKYYLTQGSDGDDRAVDYCPKDGKAKSFQDLKNMGYDYSQDVLRSRRAFRKFRTPQLHVLDRLYASPKEKRQLLHQGEPDRDFDFGEDPKATW